MLGALLSGCVSVTWLLGTPGYRRLMSAQWTVRYLEWV